MESLSNKKKVLEQKPLNFAERMYLPAIVKGLGTTMSHFFKKSSTIRYPEQVREFSINWRGMHSLKRDEEGKERCTACGLCEEACPKEAIYLDGPIVPSDYLRKDFIYGKDKLVEAPLEVK